jgi:hypothetical protein
MRAPDTTDEPVVGSTPQFGYKNRVARLYEARRTGDKFLPLPGGYAPEPNQILRGGAFPRTTDVEPGTLSQGSSIVGSVQDQSQLRPKGSRNAALGGMHRTTSFFFKK